MENARRQFSAEQKRQINGEAANRHQEEFKDNFPDGNRRRMRGFRNRIVHDDFGIDYSIVWLVKESFPPLTIAPLQPLSQA